MHPVNNFTFLSAFITNLHNLHESVETPVTPGLPWVNYSSEPISMSTARQVDKLTPQPKADQESYEQLKERSLNAGQTRNIDGMVDQLSRYLHSKLNYAQEIVEKGVKYIVYLQRGVIQVVGLAKFGPLYINTKEGPNIAKQTFVIKVLYSLFNAVSSSIRMALTHTNFSCVDIPSMDRRVNISLGYLFLQTSVGRLCGLERISPSRSVSLLWDSPGHPSLRIPYRFENLKVDLGESTIYVKNVINFSTNYKLKIDTVTLMMDLIPVTIDGTPSIKLLFKLIDITGYHVEIDFPHKYIPQKEEITTYIGLLAGAHVKVSFQSLVTNVNYALSKKVLSLV